MADVCSAELDAVVDHPSMAEPTEALLDTSVLIDHDVVDPATLPDESAITAMTLAELAAGPHATGDDGERARRQDRLQWASSMWEPFPFDALAARAYGRVFAATRVAGSTSRTKLADMLIAATAAARGLSLYTRNPSGFVVLDGIVDVIRVCGEDSAWMRAVSR